MVHMGRYLLWCMAKLTIKDELLPPGVVLISKVFVPNIHVDMYMCINLHTYCFRCIICIMFYVY